MFETEETDVRTANAGLQSEPVKIKTKYSVHIQITTHSKVKYLIAKFITVYILARL